MDPTVPNSNGPQGPNPPKSPIQPGQFVVAGEEENGVFKQPPAPQPQIQEPTQAAPPPPPPPQPQPQIATPQPPQAPESPPPQPVSELPQAAPPTEQFPQQPSPTPYVPPNATGQVPPSQPSTIGKLRVVLIILGFLLLIGLLGALVWFFVLNKKSPSSPARTTSDEAPIEIPTPLPVRQSGGFSELPPATNEAQESTPAGQ